MTLVTGSHLAPPPASSTLFFGDFRVTTDEELNVLETQLRRLKIEYEVFFSNPTKRPPTDVEWKVLSLLRKFSDGVRMNFSQRYRYNELAQRYAVYSDLWRKKSRIREEGYRRPQDALLSVQGIRVDADEHKPKHQAYGLSHTPGQTAAAVAPGIEPMAMPPHAPDPPPPPGPIVIHAVDQAERPQVERLYQTLVDAKKMAGENVSGNLDSFSNFVQKKTQEIRKQYGCQGVEFSVELAGGQVKLKAKAKA
jgi:hypothetical protein